MQKTIVRYKIKPGRVAENIRLVQAVYDQIAQEKPLDFQYSTYQLEDEVSFVHIALYGGNGKVPLSGFSSFKDFQLGIKDRCDELPVVSHAKEIGFYPADLTGMMQVETTPKWTISSVDSLL